MNAPNVSFAKSMSAVIMSCKSFVPCNEVPVPCNAATAAGNEALLPSSKAPAPSCIKAPAQSCTKAPAPCTQTPINQINDARMVKNMVRAAVSKGRPDSPNFVMFPVNPYRLTNCLNISLCSIFIRYIIASSSSR